ncbi:MAG: response regulator [Gammaproteobacteria bacterium]|nr:response regulator [Gammaproteobacteria bacterium]
MAEKTKLSADEVAELLMISPLRVFEWVQQGRLHVHLQDGLDTVFSREDLRFFAQMRGLNISHPDKGKQRILIVDSDPQLTRFLVDLFDTLSETVVAAAVHTAFEAGQHLQRGGLDIVLMDLMLSNQEGIEMCRRIKSDYATRHVRLVTMVDYLNAEQTQRSLMLGAEACLAKPLDHQKLFKAMGLSMDIRKVCATVKIC